VIEGDRRCELEAVRLSGVEKVKLVDSEEEYLSRVDSASGQRIRTIDQFEISIGYPALAAFRRVDAELVRGSSTSSQIVVRFSGIARTVAATREIAPEEEEFERSWMKSRSPTMRIACTSATLALPQIPRLAAGPSIESFP